MQVCFIASIHQYFRRLKERGAKKNMYGGIKVQLDDQCHFSYVLFIKGMEKYIYFFTSK
jgi:hypothetical protein